MAIIISKQVHACAICFDGRRIMMQSQEQEGVKSGDHFCKQTVVSCVIQLSFVVCKISCLWFTISSSFIDMTCRMEISS